MKDKQKNKQKEVLNGKTLKDGDKKLNGPNRPST
ncbi:spore protein [Paucisalibacillus globulus]|nr:spore protein [Paucisalibacillus globulus]